MAKAKLTESRKLGPFVSFQPNRRAPIHRWFEYKEGFSRDLVFWLSEQFNLSTDSYVLDPFCGVGTTQLACAELGIKATGFDINPLLVFVAKTKLAAPSYNKEKIKSAAKGLLKPEGKVERQELPSIVERGFSKWALEDLLLLRAKILEMNDDIKDFFLLALASAAVRASWTVKDGSMIKVVKRKVPPLNLALRSQINVMLSDLKNAPPIKNSANWGDARYMRIASDSVDAIITSPPYLNKLEHTKAYAIEEWIISEKISELSSTQVSGSKNLEKAYFSDMKTVLKEMARVCKNRAKIAVVIGGGCFPDRVVQSDEIISDLAEKVGMEAKKILVANRSWCTRARTIKVGQVRESIVLLQKT